VDGYAVLPCFPRMSPVHTPYHLSEPFSPPLFSHTPLLPLFPPPPLPGSATPTLLVSRIVQIITVFSPLVGVEAAGHYREKEHSSCSSSLLPPPLESMSQENSNSTDVLLDLARIACLCRQYAWPRPRAAAHNLFSQLPDLVVRYEFVMNCHNIFRS
jgi:hypothetical protein